MKRWEIILILFLLWQIEYLPIPVFCKFINEVVQKIIIFLPLIILVVSIVLTIKWKKYWSIAFIPLFIFVFLFDIILGDVKRTICNYVIVYSNYYLQSKNAFNPILGVVMEKKDSVAIFNWSFTLPESGEQLFYYKNHHQQSSDDREECIIINNNWYYTKFDIEF